MSNGLNGLTGQPPMIGENTAAASGAGAAAGGADPVSAIANAAGSLFNMVGGIITGSQNRKMQQQEYRMMQAPGRIDFFDAPQAPPPKDFTLPVLIIGAALLAVYMVFRPNK